MMQLKLAALKLAFPLFQARKPNDAQRQAFERFVTEGGDSLYQQAAFDALHAHGGQRRQPVDGRPARGLSAGAERSGAAVLRQTSGRGPLYLWLQWLAATQFAQCFEQSRQQQMPIGLYRDLAVGVAEGGAEAPRPRAVLPESVGRRAAGHPGPLGQNWGLPPMDPHVMAARGYQPFIDLLRANMTSCARCVSITSRRCCGCGGSLMAKPPIAAPTSNTRWTICWRCWRWKASATAHGDRRDPAPCR